MTGCINAYIYIKLIRLSRVNNTQSPLLILDSNLIRLVSETKSELLEIKGKIYIYEHLYNQSSGYLASSSQYCEEMCRCLATVMVSRLFVSNV